MGSSLDQGSFWGLGVASIVRHHYTMDSKWNPTLEKYHTGAVQFQQNVLKVLNEETLPRPSKYPQLDPKYPLFGAIHPNFMGQGG